VSTRRILAFVIDYIIVALLTIPFAILVFFLGLLTLGLGWMLFGAWCRPSPFSTSGTHWAVPTKPPRA
jgi:uncharacterized RDD family membrane protein YckC